MQLNVTLNSAHVKFDVLKGRGGYFGLIVMHLFKAHTRSATTDIDTHTYTKKTSEFDKTVAWTIAVKRGLKRYELQ